MHASPPERAPLEGRLARLEPFEDGHREPLYRALHDGGDPALFDYLPYGPFEAAEWDDYFARSARSEDPLFYAVVVDGRPVGQATYLRVEPYHGVIEIGHLAFGPALQRTPAATEAIYLLARNAFETLGHRRLEWKCDSLNARSRRAAERFGFTFEGIFRQHMLIRGRNRDTAWYSIIDSEWPAVRSAFEAWLAPGNFSADGRQRRRLEELRERIDP